MATHRSGGNGENNERKQRNDDDNDDDDDLLEEEKERGKRKNRVGERSEETRTSIPKICMCSRGRTSEHVQWRETRRTRA